MEIVREKSRVAFDLLMGKHHQDINHSNILEPALQASKEEEAVLCIRVFSAPVMTQITVHEDSLGVAKDVLCQSGREGFLVRLNMVI